MEEKRRSTLKIEEDQTEFREESDWNNRPGQIFEYFGILHENVIHTYPSSSSFSAAIGSGKLSDFFSNS